ncbi:MAG: hypothetical protein RBS91_09275 [Sulfurimonadaceae bacterium]|jgi:hypothetical protein|nr:hypothetical protein [Sulfurimonadaceae bacterium]
MRIYTSNEVLYDGESLRLFLFKYGSLVVVKQIELFDRKKDSHLVWQKIFDYIQHNLISPKNNLTKDELLFIFLTDKHIKDLL